MTISKSSECSQKRIQHNDARCLDAFQGRGECSKDVVQNTLYLDILIYRDIVFLTVKSSFCRLSLYYLHYLKSLRCRRLARLVMAGIQYQSQWNLNFIWKLIFQIVADLLTHSRVNSLSPQWRFKSYIIRWARSHTYA